jgi:hypothetical protein
MPEVIEKLASLGIVIVGGTTQQAQARVPTEVNKWADVIRKGNLQLN